MKTATLKTLEQTDNVSLYSICFDGKAITEYEAFLRKFKDDAKLNEDYKKIILALEKIVAVGAFERFFRPEGKMNDHVAALSIDSRKLRLSTHLGSDPDCRKWRHKNHPHLSRE